MSWAGIVSGALRLLNALATYFNNKQLMDAGRADARAEFTGEALRRVRNANAAYVRARNADRVPDDFGRD